MRPANAQGERGKAWSAALVEAVELCEPQLPLMIAEHLTTQIEVSINPGVFSFGQGYTIGRYDIHHPLSVNTSGGLASFFMTHRPALARFLRARLRGDADTEDILQDLWLKLSTVETGPVAEPLAYLYRMAENLVRDRHRSASRRAVREIDWTRDYVEGSVDAPVDGQPSAERILLARDHLRRVNAALDELPEKTAFAFRAVRIDGTPQKEIAGQMGISVSAVEKHLQKAYRRVIELQHDLDADCDNLQRLGHKGLNDVCD